MASWKFLPCVTFSQEKQCVMNPAICINYVFSALTGICALCWSEANLRLLIFCNCLNCYQQFWKWEEPLFRK